MGTDPYDPMTFLRHFGAFDTADAANSAIAFASVLPSPAIRMNRHPRSLPKFFAAELDPQDKLPPN